MFPFRSRTGRPLAIISLWLLLVVSRLSGAPVDSSGYLMDLWTSDNDLPDSSVTAVTQTPDGYLWIGTYNGLARFDGVRFVTFDPVNTPQLKHARVYGLFIDPAGTLWINTYDGSMTSLRQGVFTHEWQGGQVSAVYYRSNQIFFATLSAGVKFRSLDARGTNGWQTISLDRRSTANMFRQDADGVIWYLLRDGRIGRIVGTNAVLLPDNALAGARANYLSTDRAGQVWVGTDRGIARWDTSHFTDETPTNGEPVVNTAFLFCTADHGLWTFANGSVRHVVDRRWTDRIESWSDLLQGSSIYVGAYEEKNGDVWFRSFGQGLFHIRPDGKAEQISSVNGLPGNRVNCWFQDREGNIWVGADRGGLVRLRKKPFQIISAAGEQQNFAVSSVCEDILGTTWIGTFGGGLNRWRDGQLKRFDLPDGVNRDAFFSVCPDSHGRLWISADREDLFVYETNTLVRFAQPVRNIKCLLVDHSGQVWMGRQNSLTCWTNGGFVNFGAANGFERRDVRALAEDRDGAIWIGTGNGVLYRYAGGTFAAFKPGDGSENQAIWSLLPDADGTIWVGTFRGGLLRFKDGVFTRFNTQNGLPSDVICQILDDGLGKLWIGSHKGIFYVTKASLTAVADGSIPTLACTSYGLYDGLPTLECSGNYQPACWRSHDGQLWFATIKGVVAVDPNEVRPNQLPPPVAVEDVLLDGKSVAAAGSPPAANMALPISPGRHQLDFYFTALSFTAPDKVRFRYHLAGFDNAWVEAGTKRTAHYGPLPPGQYRFEVMACNNDGVWNTQSAVFTVKQLPYFWQTWWFVVLALGAVIVIVAAVVRQAATRALQKKMERWQQQRALERERERIARDIHDDLGAGLTQIMLQSSLARQESTGRMQTDLAQISETARDLVRTMDEIVWAINPENDSLDGLVTYLGKFVQEFLSAAKLRCRLDLPAELPPIAVSAETRHDLFLALKEALNNVLKHSQATEVSFQLQIKPDVFTFIIKDNGVGFDPGVLTGGHQGSGRISAGHGLRNLSVRLAEMGGVCTVTSAPGQGARVELTVPVTPQRRPGA